MAEMLQGSPEKSAPQGNPPRQHEAYNWPIWCRLRCLLTLRFVPRLCLPDEAGWQRLYGTTQGKRRSDTWGRHNRLLSGWSPICVTQLKMLVPDVLLTGDDGHHDKTFAHFDIHQDGPQKTEPFPGLVGTQTIAARMVC